MLKPDMENSEPAHASESGEKPKKRDLGRLEILITAILGLGIVAGAYMVGNARLTNAVRQNDALKTQASSLQKQVKQQDDINKGIASVSDGYKDPDGGLGMVDGAITFTMPKDWSRVSASDCSGGSRDSAVLCYDVAAIAPKSLIDAEGNSSWSAEVAVFEYKSSEGNAQNWYETRYDGTPLVNYDVPSILNLKTDPINGDSTISFQAEGEVYKGTLAYTNAFYALVHGKYAVLVHARLQDGGVYGGVKLYDYRSTYEPILRQFIQSVRFKE